MRIDIVYYDDWAAMYVEGRCVYQNHSLSGVSALTALARYGRRLVGRGRPSATLEELELWSHSPLREHNADVESEGCAPEVFNENLMGTSTNILA